MFDEGGQGGAAGVEAWWAALPNAFHVVRAPAGGILAFHAFALSAEADAALRGRDPRRIAGWPTCARAASPGTLPFSSRYVRWPRAAARRRALGFTALGPGVGGV